MRCLKERNIPKQDQCILVLLILDKYCVCFSLPLPESSTFLCSLCKSYGSSNLTSNSTSAENFFQTFSLWWSVPSLAVYPSFSVVVLYYCLSFKCIFCLSDQMQNFSGHRQQMIKCYMLITLGRTLFIEGGYKGLEPTPVFLLAESHGQRSLVGYSPRVTKSWTWLSDYHTEGVQKS